ncbi:hypothetical protein JOC49_000816 [Fusibacter tunisiensis]|uniref:ATP synthase subunit I n=2 Tax=Fusibacter tunisiensis TaxID=1008308 RepID=A0ABS2MPG2_9FIRM|nr:hypothetical protein [Fusibacter tunisiensis]
MDSVRQLEFRLIKIMGVFDLVLVGIGLLFFKEPWAFIIGVVFGSAIAALNFLQLGNTLTRAVTLPPKQAQAYTTTQYFIRFLISGVVIALSIKAPYINVLGTVLGLVSIKFIILATHLFNDKTYYKNIFKRKEDESNGH